MKTYSIQVPSGNYEISHSDSYEAFEVLLEKVKPSDIIYLKQFDNIFEILKIS